MSSLPLVGRLACRLVPAGLFLWAGISKALDPQGSVLSVDGYEVLPDPVVQVVAILLPWIEIAIATLLILGLFMRFAGLATVALMIVFIAGMAQAKARGLEIDCGCFGSSGAGEGVSWWDILRDVPLVLAGLYLASRPRGPWQLDNLFGGEMEEDDEHDNGTADQAAATARRS